MVSQGSPLSFNPSCQLCGKTSDEPLHTHHKDGNHDNQDPDNRMDICAECHRKITPSIKDKEKKAPPTNGNEDFWCDYDEGPATMKVKKKAYPAFKQFILGYLLTHTRIDKDEAISQGMNIARCSGQAIKYEYLRALTAKNGPLEIDQYGMIGFRGSWLEENPDVKEAVERSRALGQSQAGILRPVEMIK